MTNELRQVASDDTCSLYSLKPLSSAAKNSSLTPLNCYVASTPETRAICNDPGIIGLAYTDALKTACAATLKAFQNTPHCVLEEEETVVLHILRGGLNFGLREAVGQAFGWNAHVSAFISAQRQRKMDDTETWEIIESEYRKVYLPPVASIVFGDVVATGTSLRYGLEQLQAECEKTSQQLRSVVFFTIGAGPTEVVLAEFDAWARSRYTQYQGTTLIYFEGRFGVATPQTSLQIKYTGTDLIREAATMAPEFIDSQFQDPCYPIERCTIYDAGSRAFWIPEYQEDVYEYWHAVHQLALQGQQYAEYLEERYPNAPASLPRDANLVELAERQLEKFSPHR